MNEFVQLTQLVSFILLLQQGDKIPLIWRDRKTLVAHNSLVVKYRDLHENKTEKIVFQSQQFFIRLFIFCITPYSLISHLYCRVDWWAAKEYLDVAPKKKKNCSIPHRTCFLYRKMWPELFARIFVAIYRLLICSLDFYYTGLKWRISDARATHFVVTK